MTSVHTAAIILTTFIYIWKSNKMSAKTLYRNMTQELFLGISLVGVYGYDSNMLLSEHEKFLKRDICVYG